MATIVVERDVPITVRDGTVLRADLYRPAEGGPVPALVQRTPYSKSNARSVASFILNPLNAADRGYVVVIQDVRGRFRSDGEWVPFHVEADDGYDTVEWCARQPWCNGQVGIYGSSYGGVAVWQTLVSAPPHLTAAFAYVTASDYDDGWTYTGGAFELGFNVWWTLSLAWDRLARLPAERIPEARRRLVEAATDPRKAYRSLPLRRLAAFQEVAPYYDEWLRHPAHDDYWEAVGVSRRLGRVAVPVLQMTGWYDIFLNGHLANYLGIKANAATEQARTEQKLIIGPWSHENYLGMTPTRVGEVEFGPVASPNVEPLVFRWFDHWLMGKETGIDAESPVRIFVTGANVWRDEPDWPPARARATRLYLRSHGHANTLGGDGMLGPQPPEAEAPDTYVYDPADPVPTIGGRVLMAGIVTGGIFDQTPVEKRPDVLVYTSAPLDMDTEVTGPIAVDLWATSSAPDTDFTAKLVDVDRERYAANLAEGIIRARYRASRSSPSLLAPGAVYRYTIDLSAISHVFKAGHCIRLEISSSNFPRFDRNPNTGRDPGDDAVLHQAVQTIYHDREHPSYVVLPVVAHSNLRD